MNENDIQPIFRRFKLSILLNQAQINKYSIYKNSERVDHEYKVRDNVMFINNDALKYETP